MKYTIQQINRAWIKFNEPLLLVDNGKQFTANELKDMDMIEKISIHGKTEFIQRQDFISFLIEFYREEDK